MRMHRAHHEAGKQALSHAHACGLQVDPIIRSSKQDVAEGLALTSHFQQCHACKLNGWMTEEQQVLLLQDFCIHLIVRCQVLQAYH